VQDEILTRIAKIADLKVISRTSTQKYRGARDNLRAIAQELGVTNVLEGSVQKAGDRVRITVQLINAQTDAHLWAETYDHKLVDIFAVQTDVAQKIARALEARLTGSEKRAIAHIGTTHPEAYDLYLRAVALRGALSGNRVLEYCRRAVQLDPKFAQAWALLATTEASKYVSVASSDEQLARARHAAETALSLDPDLGESRAAMGSFKYYCLQDLEGALQEFEEARARLPNDAHVLVSIGLVKRRQGKLDESIEVHRQAAEVDPRNTDVWMNLARSYRGARKFAEAHRMFDRALDILPGDPTILAQKSETYVASGDLDGAERLLQNLHYRHGENGYSEQLELLIYRRDFARAIAKVEADYAQDKDRLPELFDAIVASTLAELRVANGIGVQLDDGLPDELGGVVAGRVATGGGVEGGDALVLLLKGGGVHPVLEAEARLEKLRAEGSRSWFLHNMLLRALALLGKRTELDALATETRQISAGDA